WLAPRDWRTAYPVLVLVDRPRSAALAALREAHARDPRALTVLTERTAPRSRARPAAGWEAYRTPWRDGTDPHRPWELALGAAAARSLAAVTAGPAARPARRWERVRNRYAAALVVTVLALAAGGVAHRVLVWSCRPGVAGENVEVDAGEEIGYRFCGRPFGGSASRSAPYQRLIFAENRRVDALRAADPRRPLLTLVVLTALTAPRADSPHSQVGESEDLAGVYAAQHGTNHTADGPLLRVVVANAGAASYKIEQAAALLRELLEADPSVFAGVVTLDSRYAVQQALRRLDSPRFAMITPTMTADGFGSPLPHFFQMIAPNAAQARLVRAYVDAVAPGARLVDVYGTPADGDLYVTTLRTALRAAFGPARFASLEWFRSSEREPRGAKDRLRAYCGRAGHVLFFGGRYTDFGDFAWDLVDTCNGRVPLVIADDSTSRFIVDRRLAATAPPGLAVVMATKGVLLSCRRLLDPTFAQAGAGEAGRGLAPRKQFRTDVQQALRRCLDAGAREQGDEFTDLTGGWAATAYDAVRLLLWADRQLRHDTPRETRADGMVRLLAGAGPLALGVNSPIQFDARRVTDTRRTSLVCLRDLSAAAATHAPGDVAVEVMRGGAAYPTDGAAPEPVTCPPPPGARTGS
ncbi:MAG TPA: hypothetical protein VFY17_01650, partial [Pilimelia sp.]|nr:hypothetical protein [Pilimelia sp.]